MIAEVVKLMIKQNQVADFQAAFKEAELLLSKNTGYISHSLKQSLDDDHCFLLQINWQTVADHQEGFRKSNHYQQWKQLLHHFYEPFPTVEYFK